MIKLFSTRDYINSIITLVFPCIVVFLFTVPSLKLTFAFLFSILFLYLGITLNFIFKKFNKNIVFPHPYTAVFRLLFLLIFMFFFSTTIFGVSNKKIIIFSYLVNKLSNILNLFICLYTFFIFIWFLFEFIFGIYKYIKDPKDIVNKWGKVESVSLLIIFILTVLLLPDFIFGILYSFMLNLYDSGIITSKYIIWQFSYTSFLIHYALPLNSETIQNYIKLINDHTLTRVLQILHIIICKLLDLTFVSISIKYLLKFFKPNNKENA